MRKIFVCLFFIPLSSTPQDLPSDSVKLLNEVIIQAYSAERVLSEVPASIGYLGANELQRFNNTSILPAVNTIPGVRMEERSPGSYRFSIRGSLLRSPFGVRNVKAYWNGLPLTDGGGNTYLNLLDFNSIGTIEIIKGPGGSLYGAGTGGVLLLNSPLVKQSQWEFSAVTGSYGLRKYLISQQFHSRKFSLRLQFAGQQSDGYREQTEMRRYALNGDLVVRLSTKGTLSSTFFYSNLSYETPGGLTKTQYDANPKQARPAGGPNLGAVDQQAAVYNQTPYLGLSYEHEWNDRWTTRLGIFGSHSDFANPAIRQYEERDETNAGARTETQFKFGKNETENRIIFGGEYQHFKSPINVFDNNLGFKGAVQTKDDLTSRLLLFFGQAEFELPADFYLTLGGSVNFLSYDFLRSEPAPITEQQREFDAVFSPRVALLKKVSENLSLFGNVSRGFSPPSLAEVRPSTNTFNNTLQAETGINYEIGFRGNLLSNKLSYDITLYDFALNETIIIQRASDGAEYFVNAGKTSQRGVEATVSWSILKNANGLVSSAKIWNSYSYNHYRFNDYIQDGTDYSKNKITGIPPTVNSSGLDLTVYKRFYLNVTANYVDHIPLNDANTIYASEYFLVGSRLGFKTNIKNKYLLDLFTGLDNALDKKYSLGNDLNALGGRYFNAAQGINFYAGLKFTLAPFKKLPGGD